MSFGAEHRLATYGSLAPGRVNHHRLRSLRGTWTEGTVRGHFIRQGWGASIGFPAMRPAANGQVIAVHILESADLPATWPALDEFEGTDYVRVEVLATLDDGSERPCFIYALSTEANTEA